ncbi:hypothetical protein CI238_10726, partial [Colletotrichum incanum]
LPMARVSETTTTALNEGRGRDDDVIFLGSRTRAWCRPTYNIGTLPTAVASATTKTTSPQSHDHNDDVICLGSRTATRLNQLNCPRPHPNDKRQSSRQSSKKQKPKRETSHRGPVAKAARLEYAHVGWILSSGNEWQVAYGSLNRSGQLCYWSDSAHDHHETIKHEDIHFLPMFQGLRQDVIRKMLPGKMRRARGRSLRDER